MTRNRACRRFFCPMPAVDAANLDRGGGCGPEGAHRGADPEGENVSTAPAWKITREALPVKTKPVGEARCNLSRVSIGGPDFQSLITGGRLCGVVDHCRM